MSVKILMVQDEAGISNEEYDRIRLIFAILIAIVLGGCTFIIKDDHTAKYYGIDQLRGSEYLNQILDKQQVYQAEKASVSSKRP